MKVIKYLLCFCLISFWTSLVRADENDEIPMGFPKVAFTYDFNTLFAKEDGYGFRMQLSSIHKFFGPHKKRKTLSGENTFAYAYGIGIGDYNIKSKEGIENDIYHVYAMFLLSYRNKSFLEPFLGLYPGGAWGIRSGVFCNPTMGFNITTFHINRNWSSKLLQTYVQLRIEYNTLLSTVFVGGGLMLHFE